MATIHAGTDTYGRVKSVAGTPIVTKFAMLQFFPLYPLQSFYYRGAGPSQSAGIPFFAYTRSVAINGIPLASVDATSVMIAYARGVFAALAVVGFIVILPGILVLTGERLDPFAMVATVGLLMLLVTGIVGGLLTYLIPLTPPRERRIREYCAELLGVSADPARVPPEMSGLLVSFVNERFGF